MEELIKWIETGLPYEGEWWKDGYNSFIQAASKMIDSGMSIEDIKAILSSLYEAVASEYE